MRKQVFINFRKCLACNEAFQIRAASDILVKFKNGILRTADRIDRDARFFRKSMIQRLYIADGQAVLGRYFEILDNVEVGKDRIHERHIRRCPEDIVQDIFRSFFFRFRICFRFVEQLPVFENDPERIFKFL